jgi:hypothetical protein
VLRGLIGSNGHLDLQVMAHLDIAWYTRIYLFVVPKNLIKNLLMALFL